MYLWTEEDTVEFWMSSTSRSRSGNFFQKHLSALWDGHFVTIWLISVEKL